ncbi:pyridoxal phosphate-dependent transferase [Aspergillus karnatakaensis]|uniref:pyridoxal phosphate-dependent transferase n=1 Tax=Aspergillus karnatakaensis TaxID=1810916 RepID=UPI003CCD57C3
MASEYLNIPRTPPDTAFSLMASFDADPHPNKVSLIAGAYRDENGKPWILPSVQKAKNILSKSPNHEYLGIAGSQPFLDLAAELIFGQTLRTHRKEENNNNESIASIQTVSGTGANHLAAVFLSRHLHPARVFIPDPTWINHRSIWEDAGVAVVEYPYYSSETRDIDMERLLAALETTEENDVIVLQACAHNPTGVDLSRDQWRDIGEVVFRKGLFVVFDSAYQGFATGDVEGDVWGVRYFAERVLAQHNPDTTAGSRKTTGLIVAQSFSKNFGLYGERVGALHLVVPPSFSTGGAKSALAAIARAEYSNPPRFGASIVETVLGDSELRVQWEKDLETMSSRFRKMRGELRGRLEGETGMDWGFVERQIGMFSYTGLSGEQAKRLREEFHVYLLPSGRMSVCGLNEGNVEYVANAVGMVLRG